MEQDIRELFKEDGFTKKELPSSHRTEFLEKLNDTTVTKKSRFSNSYILKIVALLLVFLSVGYFSMRTINEDPSIIKETALETQIKIVEAEYLKSIEAEWESFLLIANDDKLVKRYKQKLKSLDEDYKDISEKFKTNTSDIVIVEALVENLKRRLQLLKNIQQHINILNQKSDSYEKNNI